MSQVAQRSIKAAGTIVHSTLLHFSPPASSEWSLDFALLRSATLGMTTGGIVRYAAAFARPRR